MDALYVKTASGLQKVEIGGTGGGGSVSRKVFTSSNRSETLTAGTALVVPTYTKGDNSLSLEWNGLHLAKGVDYTEATTTTVTFAFDLATNDVVRAVIIGGSGVGSSAGSITTTVDERRDTVLTAGTTYAVAAHPLLENRVSVFLDGVAYTDFEEATATTIKFLDDIPATMQIVVRVET